MLFAGTDTGCIRAYKYPLNGEFQEFRCCGSPITQLIELPNTRAMLRRELRLAMQPHVLLRVGRAPLTPATRRRRLVDLLTEAA